ncbi:Polyphenol oxidase [Alphaproteobacteria bacterium SO-S41]|nr:Polyphenol oxidase [Alphaproteobacteria bacterium SO-S41]
MRILRSELLARQHGIAHGFFGRIGGVSTGVYESLNCGPGSNDNPAHVAENRARVATLLGIAPANLLSLYQIHSPIVLTVTKGWTDDRPQADGMVTRVPGLALGILAADCTPILFADIAAGVVGACHAGWKGAFAGVAEATIDAMTALGANRSRIAAAIGPTIRQASYEVGADFRDRFVEAAPANAAWFIPGAADGKFQFDLPGYLTHRLRAAGIQNLDDCGIDTYVDGDFFSYRRTTHRREPDYGRNISAIALTP